jgi:multiple sugar transport system permease protein
MRNRRHLAWTHVALIGLSVLFLAPILWLASIALKRPSDIAALPVQWLPPVPQWGNFAEALTYIDFLGYARNSLIIAVLTAVLTTLSSAFVGFGLARLRAPGKNAVFAVLVATLMLPPIVTVIPTFLIFSRAHLVNTYWPWVLWGLAGSAYLIFLFRQSFRSLPGELEDAAILDGCNYFQIWWRIYLPLSKPVIAASVVLSFVAAWGDYLTPKLLLRQDTTTLAVAITTGYTDENNYTINTLLAAGALMFAVPVIVLFFVLQRYFVQGFATSGLK